MKEKYIDKNFRQETLDIIEMANAIVEEYKEKNLNLTLRQLYYQFVSRNLLSNTTSSYNKLGSIISNARLAGLLDWSAIEDRTRNLKGAAHWSDPGSIIKTALYSYRIDKWKNQEFYIEVWIEKEALIGVISGICDDLDINYFACKGYVSQSEMYKGAERMKYENGKNKECIIIHLGDHDPAGIDMTRDIQERQNLFCSPLYKDVYIKRIALNMDQIEKYNPPPNPVKLTDTKAKGYIKKFGNRNWELDALDPTTLEELIEETVLYYRDENIYQQDLLEEKEHKKILENLSENWENL